MSRLILALLLGAAPAPLLAQHEGHSPAPDPHTGHRPQQPQAAQPAPDPHAGHRPSQAAPDPHAGHRPQAPQPATDPHAGHQPAADPHAGHQPGATDGAPPAPPVAPPPPEALSGPAHAADALFGSAQMAAARDELHSMHGDIVSHRILIDRLELGISGGHETWAWEAEGWYGSDLDRLWLKTEGEGAFGGAVEQAEVQALWSHALDPWFNLQAGLRYDIRPDPERAHLVLGVQGLAPYWFEVDAAAFLSDEGDVTARLEGEYDFRITQRLLLQPRLELDLSLQDIPELGIGAGLSTAEAGLRLRYEFVPEFAPYVGVQYERAFGDTADFRRLAGEDVGGWSLLLGIRTWF